MLRSSEYANHIFVLVGPVCFKFCILGDKHGTLFLFSEKKGSDPGFFTNNHRLLRGPLQLTCLHKIVVPSLSTSGRRKIVRLPYGNALRIPGPKGSPTSPYFMLCPRAAGVGGAWDQSKTRAASPPKSIMSCSARVQKANTRSSDLFPFPHCHTFISLLPLSLSNPSAPTPHGSAFPSASAPTLALVPQFRQLPFHRLHA